MNEKLLGRLKSAKVLTQTNRISINSEQILHSSPDIYDDLLSATTFLTGKNIPLFERIYCVVKNIKDQHRCKKCSTPLRMEPKFIAANKVVKSYDYREFCSRRCANKDPNRQEQIKQTNFNRYGVEHTLQVPFIREKGRETVRKKYGVDHILQSEDMKSRIRKTNMEKYGVPCTLHAPEIQEKVKKSLGKGHNWESIPEKTKQKLQDRNWLTTEYKTNSSQEIAESLGVSPTTILRALHSFNVEISNEWFSSSIEKSVESFIRSCYSSEIRRNTRDLIPPHEIDIYLPDKKLAIEVNGIVWHSEVFGGKDKNYHLNKSENAEKNGIRLFHIYDIEWNSPVKRKIWESILLNALGQTPVAYARKCEIIQLSPQESRSFFDENHLQGYTPSNIDFGLTHQGELVAAMTFGKSRYSKDYEYEMLRFCNKSGTRVIGGGGKLFTHFQREFDPDSIVSFADRRYTTGALYTKLGFDFSHHSKPNFFYFKQNDKELKSRIPFQKHKLPNILEHFDPTLSAWGNMRNHGYDRIWDCGNRVFVCSK